MKTIVYASWCERPPSMEAVLAILKTARANNRLHGIVGALLLVDSMFLQALEGPADAVDRLMSNIRRDRRHQGVLTLLEESHGQQPPMFGDWSMGFCRLGAVDEIAGKGLQPLDLGPLLATLERHPDRRAAIILRAFIDANRGALRADAA